MTTPHDAPDAVALVEAVREFLDRDVLASTSGRVRFHARVASNVLAMVERELVDGADHHRRHAAGLGRLGLVTEGELATAIRSGAVDDRIAEVAAFVRATVRDKLAVAHPGYADDEPRSP